MPARILIVEDNTLVATALRRCLEAEGYVCEGVEDGEEALAVARRNPPDLILLDRGLPRLPGDEVARRLRADPRCSTTPVIMVTGKDDEADELVGFAVGADDYISKPFSPRVLVARVAAQLRRRERDEHSPVSVPTAVVKLDKHQPRAFVDRVPVPLTALEYKLLSTFIASGTVVLGASQLATMVFGQTDEATLTNLDAGIANLQRKLGPGGRCIQRLEDGRYAFCHPGDERPPA